jgi:hypothetical protein
MAFKETVVIAFLVVAVFLLGIFVGYTFTSSRAATTITYTQTEYITPKPISKTEIFEKEKLVIIPANNMISFSYSLQHYGYLKISFNSSEPIYIEFLGNATLIDYYPTSPKICGMACKLDGFCVVYQCSYEIERATNGLVYVPVFPGVIRINFVNPSSNGATAVITIEYTYQSFEY